jgi:hypothetical protein
VKEAPEADGLNSKDKKTSRASQVAVKQWDVVNTASVPCEFFHAQARQ